MSRARELSARPSYEVDDEDEDDLDESEDDDYNEGDAEAEEREAAKEDDADAGNESGKKGKRARVEQHKRKSKRQKGDGLELAAVDADELAALREDAIEQFGADVLAEHDSGKSLHTRAAERAELEAIMDGLRSAEDALFAREGSGRAVPTAQAIFAALHHVPSHPAAPRGASLPYVPSCGVEDSDGQGVGTAGDFIGALNRKAYGNGRGWHTSLGGIQPRRSSGGPLLHRLMGVPPPDVAVLEARGAVVDSEGGQTETPAVQWGNGLSADALERARAIASAALALAGGKKVAVTSTVKFAGQTMTVTKMVTAGTEAAARAAAEAKELDERREVAAATTGSLASATPSSAAPLGLDAVVSNLDKPEAINTLAKTNMDWEQYKAKEGLDEQFESLAQAKGFVEKQAFLGRVEERAAEQAKVKRAEERRQRELQPVGQR